MADPAGVTVRAWCPRCESRLDILEMANGGRVVSIIGFGPTVEVSARSLESFHGPGEGPTIMCPACHTAFDPAHAGTLRPLRPRS